MAAARITLPFADRREGGFALAHSLAHLASRRDVTVLALPRGGVPVAFEVAQALGAPLDVFVVRKLGVPGHEELAFGALASGGVRVLSDYVVGTCAVSAAQIEEVARAEQVELDRRERLYRDRRPPLALEGRTVVLVDDGLATGATMEAAVRAVRSRKPQQVIVAVPVAAQDAVERLAAVADEVVASFTPPDFAAVGQWYEDFSQTSDDEVRQLLEASARAS